MTAVPSNIVLTKDSIQVTVGVVKGGVKENWTKLLFLNTTPKSTAKQDIAVGSSTTKIVDILRKAEKRITVTGVIQTDLGSGDTNSDAWDKKEDLKKIVFGGGVMSMVWAGTTYTVNMEKCEAAFRPDDQSPIEIYDVTFTVIEGVDM